MGESNLFRLILCTAQQYALSHDPDKTPDERRNVTMQYYQFESVLFKRLKKEPNNELIIRLYQEIKGMLAEQREQIGYLLQRGLDTDFEIFQNENTP